MQDELANHAAALQTELVKEVQYEIDAIRSDGEGGEAEVVAVGFLTDFALDGEQTTLREFECVLNVVALGD